MKSIVKTTGGTLLFGAILATTPIVLADTVTQESTTTTTTSGSGTVEEIAPDAIVLHSDSGSVRYRYPKTATVVDENGNVLSTGAIRSGLPVTVFYTRDGDQMVVSRVVVKKPAVIEKREESTTTTEHP